VLIPVDVLPDCLGELKAIREVPKALRELITARLVCLTPGLGGVFVSNVVTQPLKHEPPMLTALKKMYPPWDFFQGDS
jgi:hypothetical protein